MQAAVLLSKGIFSSSPRLNKLLGNCNTFPISFHHLSGKLSLNEESDIQSRNPSLCKEPECPVCKHLTEQAEILDNPLICSPNVRHISIENTSIDPPCCLQCHTCNFLKETSLDSSRTLKQCLDNEKVNNLQVQEIIKGEKTFPYLSDRKVLIQVQKNDPTLSKLIHSLQSGGRPNARNTKSNDLKTYLGFDPKLDYDGLIIVDRVIKPHLINLKIPVVPPNFAKSILLAAHLKLGHPKPAQLEKIAFRSFCSLKVKNLIKDLFNNCYTCQADLVIPKEKPTFVTESKPKCPGEYWTCDILKHGKKNIMMCTDNFSSFTICTIIQSEKHHDCENAIISSIFPFKAASGNVRIRVDTAPGLAAMLNKSSDLFHRAGFDLESVEAKNKNSLAKVDKTMAELRTILRTISPDGSTLSSINLQKAVTMLNSRIRYSNLSAREIMFSRLQDNNENIKLDDASISKDLYDKRIKANESVFKRSNLKESLKAVVHPHSLVFLKQDSSKDKSKVRDLYIVMEIDEDNGKLLIQKVLNPINNLKGRINTNKTYNVKITDVYLAPLQQKTVEASLKEIHRPLKNTNPAAELSTKCSPGRTKYYSLENDQDEDFDEVYINQNLTTKDISIEQNIQIENEASIVTDNGKLEPTSPTDETNISLSTWSHPNANQIALSPIIMQKHYDYDYGIINLSWDHSSDLSSALYDDGQLIYDDHDELVHSMVEDILAEEDMENDVFEDMNTNRVDPNDEQKTPTLNRADLGKDNQFNLHLENDVIQRGRVYRLDNNLPLPLDLRLQDNNIEIGKVYNLKRLRKGSKNSIGNVARKTKKKKKPVVDWIIKKITLAKRSQTHEAVSPEAPSRDSGGGEAQGGAASI